MISVHELSLSFGEKKVLDHFSMEFPQVPILGLTGPSGCGKTTLLRILAGLETPRSGSVAGISPDRVAFLFQEDRLPPWRTSGQNISDILPRHRKREADFLKDVLGIETEVVKSMVRSFSGKEYEVVDIIADVASIEEKAAIVSFIAAIAACDEKISAGESAFLLKILE